MHTKKWVLNPGVLGPQKMSGRKWVERGGRIEVILGVKCHLEVIRTLWESNN